MRPQSPVPADKLLDDNRHGLKEAFFQKLERHWDLVVEHVKRYMDEQTAADRKRG